MPAVFQQLGIQFQYPDNWSVDHQEGEPSADGNIPTGQVTVSSPHTAFWQLTQYPGEVDLESLFDEALSALRSEYDHIEVEPNSDDIAGQTLSRYEVNFFYLDLTNTCWLWGFETPQDTYLLLCQAEDREFEQVAPVFRAMLASVLQHIL